jgi:hypothetical protein
MFIRITYSFVADPPGLDGRPSLQGFSRGTDLQPGDWSLGRVPAGPTTKIGCAPRFAIWGSSGPARRP